MLLASLLALTGLPAAAGGAHAAAGVTITAPVPAATVGVIPFDVDFSLAEPGSDAFCRIDGGSWSACFEPAWTIDRLANGAHTVQILNRDAIGSTATASVSFTLADATAPTATVDTPADGSTLTDSGAVPPIVTTTTGGYLRALCAYDDERAVDCDLMSAYDPTPLANGNHTARVTVYDGAGNASTATSSFTMDDQSPPSLTVTSPDDATTLTDQPVFDVTVDDPMAKVYIGGTSGKIHQLSVSSGGNLIVRPPAFPNGIYDVKFFAIDAAGNQSTATRNFTVSDSTAPVLSNLQPADASTVDGDRLLVSFDSDDPAVTGTCDIDGQAPFDCYPGAAFTVNNVSAGAHQLTVSVTDQSGNWASATSDFSVSQASEGSLTIDSPANGSTYGAEPRLILSGVGPIDYVRCRLGGSGPWFDCESSRRIAGLTGGTNSLEVRALDSSGDLRTASSSFTVNDTTPPTLQIDFPAAGESVTRLSAFAPQIRAGELYADGGDSEGVSLRCKLDAASFVACDRLLDPDDALASGSHTLQVRASDWAGNLATKSVSFSAGDATAPSIRILTPQDGASFAFERPALLFWSDDPTAYFTCRVGSGPEQECLDGWTWLPHEFSGDAIGFGSHTLHVTGIDHAGNSAAASVSITVADITAPTLSIVAPGDGDTVTDHVSATWVANEKILRVRCQIDGGSWISDPEQCRAGGEYGSAGGEFVPKALTNEPHTLVIEGYDSAGNSGTASVSVTAADTTPPNVRILGFTQTVVRDLGDAPTGVEYLSDDESVSFQCMLDSAAFVACDGESGHGSWNFAPPAPGDHAVIVRATDAAGQSADASVGFTVADTSPPGIGVRIGDTPLLDGAMAPMAFTALIDLDGAVSATCSIDGAAATNCSSGTLAVNFGTGGSHTFAVTAADAASNTTVKTLRLAVDPATVPPPPVTPPVTPPANPPVTPPAAPPAPATPTIAIAAIKSKLKGSTVSVLLNVRVSPTASVFSCSGPVSINAAVGSKSIKRATSALRPANPGCSITAKLSLKKKLASGKRVKFAVSYTGNATIGAFSASRSVLIKKR